MATWVFVPFFCKIESDNLKNWQNIFSYCNNMVDVYVKLVCWLYDCINFNS